MHERFLTALQELGPVRLVASLSDERLGFPDKNDLRVLVPDIHLITTKRRKQGGFKYGTNHEELLTDVITAVRDIKTSAKPDETVAMYILGDFLDLWRETPALDERLDAAAAIRDDHEDLVAAALDPKLKTRFLLGNHDFDLFRWSDYIGWERRYYLPDATLNAPGMILLHGDVFDWVETLPDPLKQIIVYLFAPHLSANSHELGEMQRLIRKSHGKKKYKDSLRAPDPAELGDLRQIEDPEDIPLKWNVQTSGDPTNPLLKYLDSARKLAKAASSDYQMKLRTVFIGHTHQARIAVQDNGGDDFFALIDCGAWIEDSAWTEDGEVKSGKSAQITALCGNEVRVYQLGHPTEG